LLETGQSTFLRKSAAYQIGEIVKTHPHDLGQLLEKLKTLITNQSWDTRIAAAQTIESIVKHLNDFDLALIQGGVDYCAQEGTSNSLNSNNHHYYYSSLENFNLNNLLITGSKLLSSNTQKYDVKDNDDITSILTNNSNAKANELLNEKIRQQRRLLNLKLGIDVGEAAKLDTSHIFSDYDLIASTETVSTLVTQTNETESYGVKRKASVGSAEIKQEAIQFEIKNESTLTSIKEMSKKFKSNDFETEEQSIEIDETKNLNHIKSLELFTQWLLNKLFDSEWETRHGAATALREIIKRLVQCLENNFKLNNQNVTSIDKEDPKTLNWFQDCLVKLLSVIALDKFADYVGDEAVAPVRETCAQIIGIISTLFNYSGNLNCLVKLCNIINTFLNERADNCWEIRHSGIMILKYTIAATSGVTLKKTNINDSMKNLQLIFQLLFDNILNCIRDKDDDVRQVASAALEPVSKYLKNLLNESQLESLIRILIDVLSEIDDLSMSSANIMSLLSDLLSTEESSIDIKSIFLKLLNNQSIIPRLLPFLQHSNLTIRQTTLETINKIIIAIDETNEIKNTYRFESMEKSENLSLLFRLLYQQSILLSSEYSFKLIEPNLIKLWRTLCIKLSSHCLINVCFPYITTWLSLLMYPSNQPIDPNYLIGSLNFDEISTSGRKSLTTSNYGGDLKEYIGSGQVKFEDKQTRDLIQVKCRLVAGHLLAILLDRISLILDIDSNTKEKPINLIIQFLSKQINFKSGLQRFCFALLMIEWASFIKENEIVYSTPDSTGACTIEAVKSQLASKIINCLDDENTIYFDEIGLSFTRLQKECRNLLSNYSKLLSNLDLTNFFRLNVFTFEDINNLTDLIQKQYINNIVENSATPPQIKALNTDLRLSISNLIDLNQQTSQEQEQLQLRSCFSLASSSIELNCLCERMNPLIRPLIDCIRFESNSDLQQISSKHLALLLNTCSKRTPNPVPKIFKNLLNYLCNDQTKTPQINLMSNIQTLPDKEYYDINRFYGILSDLLTINAHLSSSNGSDETATTPKTKKRANSTVTAGVDLPTSLLTLTTTNEQMIKLQIEKRGAEFTFKSICQVYKENIEQIIPEIVVQPLNIINQILSLTYSNIDTTIAPTSSSISNELILINDLNLDQNISKYQDLINNLCLVEYICSCGQLSEIILEKYLKEIPSIIKLIKSSLSGIRHVASRCLASITKQKIVKSMSLLLEYTLDCLDNSEYNLFSRQGAIELVYCLFEQLNEQIIPFTVIFIVPILKRMCDLDWYIRSIASQCFATLVKLYPLGVSENNNQDHDLNSLSEITQNNANILRMKLEQQDFLDQLMDNRKLKPYQLPNDVLIDVKLRPYQQMGVNWLAFLKQFNLHGILCDDMGLGKTLQSICLLAGDHFEKQLKHEETKNDQEEEDYDASFLPSIIICPTTLTNHWFHEIERFVDNKCLRPFIYSGSVSEREKLRKIFFNSTKMIHSRQSQPKQQKSFNVFIVSYDIIRHDITYLCNQQWNYCILDEGHLIKSSKTKLSKSIKQIRASHRLILTGTPIQNNVTELWCLFDFLLPGYLGTEKQFNAKYAKFIAPQSSNSLQRSKSINSSSSDGDKGLHQSSIIALESLHKQVLPFLLRRTKEEVLNDLPPKIIQDYYCEMSQLQIDLYQDFAKSDANESVKNSIGLIDDNEEQNDDSRKAPSTQASNEHVFQALQYLRKVVNHPCLVMKPDHPRWSKVQAELKSSNSTINEYKYSGKLVALRELLMECGIGLASSNGGDDDSAIGSEFETNNVVNQHRVLIFCQLKSMIDIIENELLKKMTNVSHLRLDGTIPPSERYGIVRRFNSDPSIDILLLTTQIGGLGLNLTGADTVIFVEHDWNPQKDLQAMDRAHRIGQTKVVNVYRLITKNTIEEKIMRYFILLN
jgi:TATA-binding protein-associated factor